LNKVWQIEQHLQYQSALGVARSGKGKQFFFEKKNQKTFARLATPSSNACSNWQKFLLFLKKRSAFLPCVDQPQYGLV